MSHTGQPVVDLLVGMVNQQLETSQQSNSSSLLARLQAVTRPSSARRARSMRPGVEETGKGGGGEGRGRGNRPKLTHYLTRGSVLVWGLLPQARLRGDVSRSVTSSRWDRGRHADLTQALLTTLEDEGEIDLGSLLRARRGRAENLCDGSLKDQGAS